MQKLDPSPNLSGTEFMMVDADEIDKIVIYDAIPQETTNFVKPKVVDVDGAQLDSTQVGSIYEES
jgi:hypothetical protein